jgi:carboxyl-terminal processing protease
MQPHEGARSNRSSVRKIIKLAGISFAALFIFLFGIGIGRGNILFGSPANSANKELPEDLDYSSVEQLYDLLKVNYDGKLDMTKLLDGLKFGLATATGDPYTQYLNEKEAREFNEELNGSFTGIGAELGKDEAGNLIIVAPIDGFPADKAGLRPKDIIVAIGGKSTTGMTIDEAVTRIRGEKGTKVTLRILRNKEEDLSFTITRDQIKIASVKWEVANGNVGYIRVNQFNEDTTELMNKAASELQQKDVDSILLDLRGNPGGLLSAAIDMSSMWLGDGQTILQEKRGGVVVETYTAQGDGVFKGMPTAVLIDAGSASASEIVAGALKDNKAVTLFGEKSFGKGSVQELQMLPGGSELKVTIARWHRPNGQNIDKKGIKPDHEVKMTDDDYQNDRDPQKDSALTFLKDQ